MMPGRYRLVAYYSTGNRHRRGCIIALPLNKLSVSYGGGPQCYVNQGQSLVNYLGILFAVCQKPLHEVGIPVEASIL